jgi:hypothetical protein
MFRVFCGRYSQGEGTLPSLSIHSNRPKPRRGGSTYANANTVSWSLRRLPQAQTITTETPANATCTAGVVVCADDYSPAFRARFVSSRLTTLRTHSIPGAGALASSICCHSAGVNLTDL